MHKNDEEAIAKVVLFLIACAIAFVFASCNEDRYEGTKGKVNFFGDLISIVK